jgi:hypothetical protein
MARLARTACCYAGVLDAKIEGSGTGLWLLVLGKYRHKGHINLLLSAIAKSTRARNL